MGRIIKEIEIEGQQAVTLFDTGATYSYVRRALVEKVTTKPVAFPAHALLGDRDIEIRALCIVDGKIEGLGFFTDMVPADELGHAAGRELDAIIGATTMEHWEIRVDPKSGALDLEGLRRREFTEF